MKKADINRGMRRLVESYTPRISTSDVLDFLKNKGFDTTSPLTKEYASGVAEYLNYPENDDYELSSWYRDTLMNYPKDFKELPKLDEALSDEAKANNEMIQRILSKSPSQLTAQEKKFLADNNLVRTGGKGQTPSIGKYGAPYWNTISKGDRSVTNRGNWASKSKSTFADINNVDQLNLLKKRQDRWGAHNDRTNNDILEPVGRFGWGSNLSEFNRRYQNNIANARDWADRAKQYKDLYNQTGNSYYQQAANRYAGYNRVLRDQAKKSLENRPKFSESLEDDDYFDFVHDLSTAVKERTKRWQSRGVSASDVAKALDELSVRFEETNDEDLGESLDFKTMPISKEGATFAFRATVDEPEVSRLLKKKGFRVDKVNDNGTTVWLIGNADTNHVATYVPSTRTLYTDRRELFREALSLKKR